MDGHTVLIKPTPNDGFRASVARAIKEHARSTYTSNPDAPGAARHLSDCNRLAAYVEGLPLWDPRFRQLLQVSRDSDAFTLAGEGARFVQVLGVDIPSPPDVSAQFTEFVIACGTRSAPSPEESALVVSLRQQVESNRSADHEKIRELEAEIEKRDKAYGKLAQEASDLRGLRERWSRDGGDQVLTLSRRCAQLEGELDQANRRAAAAESKRTRRAKKVAA